MSPITEVTLKQIYNQNIGINTNVSEGLYLHDLEGAVGCVEELELLDGALRDGVESGPTPAPLHQANGLCCKQAKEKKKAKLVPILAMENRRVQKDV